MSSVYVEHTNEWLAADQDAEPIEAARALVRDQAQRQRLHLTPKRIDELAAVMMPALEIAQDEDPPPVMVLFLCPYAEDPIITSVKIRAEDLPDTTTLADLADEVRLPVEMLEQPAIEEIIDTRSGPALHVVQRHRQPVDAHVEQVQEHEVFAWIMDDDGPLLVTLSTSYVDLAAASEWRPDLIALAKTLIIEPDTDDFTGHEASPGRGHR
jgi:hypothetical protein